MELRGAPYLGTSPERLGRDLIIARNGSTIVAVVYAAASIVSCVYVEILRFLHGARIR